MRVPVHQQKAVLVCDWGHVTFWPMDLQPYPLDSCSARVTLTERCGRKVGQTMVVVEYVEPPASPPPPPPSSQALGYAVNAWIYVGAVLVLIVIVTAALA